MISSLRVNTRRLAPFCFLIMYHSPSYVGVLSFMHKLLICYFLLHVMFQELHLMLLLGRCFLLTGTCWRALKVSWMTLSGGFYPLCYIIITPQVVSQCSICEEKQIKPVKACEQIVNISIFHFISLNLCLLYPFINSLFFRKK